MNVPGYADGVAQIEGTRKSDGSWIVRFTCTRSWSMAKRGNISAVVVGRGETHDMAMLNACASFWAANEYEQLPLDSPLAE